MVVRPLNELEFITLTTKRANDSFWQRIACIQACGKNARGLGKHFIVTYKAERVFSMDDLFQEQCLKVDYKLHDHRYDK
jgi:hypothetical protein